ncbi:hypothetical protein HY024_02915 [Candidatus Curtissbacteria bacterium]|nr:hypothetical protein [Candidatus Curtissbacteria bacterium]
MPDRFKQIPDNDLKSFMAAKIEKHRLVRDGLQQLAVRFQADPQLFSGSDASVLLVASDVVESEPFLFRVPATAEELERFEQMRNKMANRHRKLYRAPRASTIPNLRLDSLNTYGMDSILMHTPEGLQSTSVSYVIETLFSRGIQSIKQLTALEESALIEFGHPNIRRNIHDMWVKARDESDSLDPVFRAPVSADEKERFEKVRKTLAQYNGSSPNWITNLMDAHGMNSSFLLIPEDLPYMAMVATARALQHGKASSIQGLASAADEVLFENKGQVLTLRLMQMRARARIEINAKQG